MAGDGIKLLCSGSWGNFSISLGGQPSKRSSEGSYECKNSSGVSKTTTIAASILAAMGGLLTHFGAELLFGLIASSPVTVISLSVIGLIIALAIAVIVIRSYWIRHKLDLSESKDPNIRKSLGIRETDRPMKADSCAKKRKKRRRIIFRTRSSSVRGGGKKGSTEQISLRPRSSSYYGYYGVETSGSSSDDDSGEESAVVGVTESYDRKEPESVYEKEKAVGLDLEKKYIRLKELFLQNFPD
ncbi:hypothetical protein [Chlamydiifrater volucris]|uniref:hypothetical protein n=1 Tax=Chlamydiifrater volucris TaxID=2681470 RepID=UPI001BCCD3E9|nr:hypothetical protein [Chlamydiifrater volucris]